MARRTVRGLLLGYGRIHGQRGRSHDKGSFEDENGSGIAMGGNRRAEKCCSNADIEEMPFWQADERIRKLESACLLF